MPFQSPVVHKDVACPFCGLLCDDLVVMENHKTLRVLNSDCKRAVRGFHRKTSDRQPRARGRPVSLDTALKRAARILKDAGQPLIAGMGTDVAGCRSALALAEQCGAIVDHMHGESAIHNMRILQSQGWFLTTLGELRNRADTVLFIGTDAYSAHPRFFERFVWPPQAMATTPVRDRKILYLGSRLDTRPGISPAGAKPLSLACDHAEIGQLLHALRGLLHGYEPPCHGSLARPRLRKLKLIRDRLLEAKYSVLVWAASDFRSSHPDLIITDICDIISALNRTTRAAGLPLGGNDGMTSWTNVCTWQSGFPTRVNFAAGAPDYDPRLFSARSLLRSGAVDALLWISCFDPHRAPPPGSVPTILLGQGRMRAVAEAEVFLPAAVPGLDHGGNLFRLDGVVGLPLRQLRLPSGGVAAELLDAIRKRL